MDAVYSSLGRTSGLRLGKIPYDIDFIDINKNATQATQLSLPSSGSLMVFVTDARDSTPIPNAQIEIIINEKAFEYDTTDLNGQTKTIVMPTPSVEFSLQPDEPLAYTKVDILVRADGYIPVRIKGSEVLPGVLSTQAVKMHSVSGSSADQEEITIPDNTLYGDYPPKIPEAEIKRLPGSGEIVLSRVVIPEYVIVHDGVPTDRNAPDYWVRYKDYIKNVASSEIYATWPREAIRANILVIQSFTLNRVYTEWYRNQGYNFTVTTSTAYDQKYVHGRNIFEPISVVVDEMFNQYLSRPGVRQPIFTTYCSGRGVECAGLTQWGSMELGQEGYSAIEIIKRFYGNDMYVNTAETISGVPASYPGGELTIGSEGEKVLAAQNQLNRIAQSYPLIPKVDADGIYGQGTANSIKIFQKVFGLPQTGVIDFATWYKLSEIYVGVTRISEP